MAVKITAAEHLQGHEDAAPHSNVTSRMVFQLQSQKGSLQSSWKGHIPELREAGLYRLKCPILVPDWSE